MSIKHNKTSKSYTIINLIIIVNRVGFQWCWNLTNSLALLMQTSLKSGHVDAGAPSNSSWGTAGVPLEKIAAFELPSAPSAGKRTQPPWSRIQSLPRRTSRIKRSNTKNQAVNDGWSWWVYVSSCLINDELARSGRNNEVPPAGGFRGHSWWICGPTQGPNGPQFSPSPGDFMLLPSAGDDGPIGCSQPRRRKLESCSLAKQTER